MGKVHNETDAASARYSDRRASVDKNRSTASTYLPGKSDNMQATAQRRTATQATHRGRRAVQDHDRRRHRGRGSTGAGRTRGKRKRRGDARRSKPAVQRSAQDSKNGLKPGGPMTTPAPSRGEHSHSQRAGGERPALHDTGRWETGQPPNHHEARTTSGRARRRDTASGVSIQRRPAKH